MQTPLIIGHRGACGYVPEHTFESYRRALELGADILETDIVPTRDGHLVCRHEPELSLTSDIAQHPEFAVRKRVQEIDGARIEGWFVEDFTLAEIRTLKARERFDFRDHALDDCFGLLTLAELLEMVGQRRTLRGRRPGVIIEIKHAAHYQSIGLPMDAAVAALLETMKLDGADAGVWVECFESDVLRRLNHRLRTPLIQLLDAPHLQPADVSAAGGSLNYGQMITPRGLLDIASYASRIGAWKRLIVPHVDEGLNGRGQLAPPTTLVADAHVAGLTVHAWTFRSEAPFLASEYGGDPAWEYRQFRDLGVDGMITDFPDAAVAALI